MGGAEGRPRASAPEPPAAPPRTAGALGIAVTAIRAAERVSPGLAAELALPLMRSTAPRLPVARDERGVHEQARRSVLRVRGRELAAYEWGGGRDTVLLMHGWRGRAAQFAPLIRELRGSGFRLVSFDAPGHGASPGRTTDMRDYLAAVDAVSARHGSLHAIVAHSLGALAAAVAVHEGAATTGRLVTIAGLSAARSVTHSFTGAIGLGAETAEGISRRYARRVLRDIDAPYERFDATTAALPVPTLIVHDRRDRQVPVGESLRLHEANPGSRLLLTEGAGHARILGDDAVLDAVAAFVG
ncbi:alpha/beta hydrolase [Agromyces archimandritae]|uniref:Alpha/beta hydrolase n=1 Tax=Agromyces archimandritae TaxID=2781962 RepID=A0A975FJU8_9MICO|nr:alpha/beta hydrolase [Agromyces archimandritae]QTX03369.1 alpha/beta hydrolase [Agromyces archimandritae]